MAAKEVAVEKKNYGPQMKSLLKIAFGNLVMGLAYAKWMVPNKIINGGVTSLALLANKVTHLSITFWTNSITGLLLIACLIFLGKENFLKSIFSSVTYLASFNLFFALDFSLHTWVGVDVALACVAISFGYYCCISANASTVGMDVIAIILNKRRPQLKIATMIRNINFIILAFGLLVFGWQSVVLGLIFSFVYSFLLKKMLGE